MSVIVAERAFVGAPELILWVGVPAALWALIIGGGVYLGQWRLFTFGAAVLVGGIGLIIGIVGLTIEIPDDSGGLGSYGAGIAAVLDILLGAALLLVGALIGFVALFLGRDSVDSSAAPASIGRLIGGQPRSEDSVDSSGPGDQESDG